MTPEIESIKHIGDIVDGKMVCREDCPSVTHKNTPEITNVPSLPHEPAVTTNEVTSGGGGNNTPETEEVQRGKEYSQVEITEYPNGEIRANGIPINTPDTEMEKEVHTFVNGLAMQLTPSNDTMNAVRLIRKDLPDFISYMRTSRDTYWKERVRKEVEWQPIETAPKDGTHILVINLNTPEWNCVPTVAHWFELSVGDETRGNFFLSWNKNADDADYQMNTITHWKALTQEDKIK